MNRRLALVPGLILAVALLLFSGVQSSSLLSAPLAATPLGTAFTYQGELTQSGTPLNSACDIQFNLFDAAVGGSLVGTNPQTATVTPTNGLFTVQLDFGANAFTGDASWLEIAPRCPSGVGSFATLSPRQPVTPAPNAVVAEVAKLLSLNGQPAQTIQMARNPTAASPGNSLTVGAGGATLGGTDLRGGDMLLAAGLGTGLGGSGNLRLETAGANDLSGTTDDLLVDRRIIVGKAKQLTLSSPGFTSIMSIFLNGTHTAGGRIFYTVRATDGGSQIATESGVLQYLATTNSITCTVQTTDKLHLGTVNSGCTPGFFNPGSHPGVSIFDNVSFSSPAPIVVHEVYFTIANESGAAIRLEP